MENCKLKIMIKSTAHAQALEIIHRVLKLTSIKTIVFGLKNKGGIFSLNDSGCLKESDAIKQGFY